MTDQIIAGFLPLTDSAILVAAKAFGFAEAEDIDLTLVRETSWANIRDRMAVGHFHAAHMLAPMPIAANLGLTPMPMKLIAPMALGLGGNAVTVSQKLAGEMQAAQAFSDVDPIASGNALKAVVRARQEQSLEPLCFGVVHPYSGHNLELRYWLAASGMLPDRDIEIIIVPPPLMPDALKSGRIDGFCVGEPYNSMAVDKLSGEIVTVKSAIWRSSPEKVLALNADWQAEHSDLTDRLLRALFRSAMWCGNVANHAELAALLARETFLGLPASLIQKGLSGNLTLAEGRDIAIDDFMIHFGRAATFPWQSHALWFYSQLVRWDLANHDKENEAVAAGSYRPDLYRRALGPLGASLPGANAKVEGALSRPTPVGATSDSLTLGPDGFFDGAIFDPEKLDAYLKSQMPIDK
ncbi:MAG: CmpA/NrtA family ABC transporter substrate-binding protein [Pseudomonadota bacterium]